MPSSLPGASWHDSQDWGFQLTVSQSELVSGHADISTRDSDAGQAWVGIMWLTAMMVKVTLEEWCSILLSDLCLNMSIFWYSSDFWDVYKKVFFRGEATSTGYIVHPMWQSASRVPIAPWSTCFIRKKHTKSKFTWPSFPAMATIVRFLWRNGILKEEITKCNDVRYFVKKIYRGILNGAWKEVGYRDASLTKSQSRTYDRTYDELFIE